MPWLNQLLPQGYEVRNQALGWMGSPSGLTAVVRKIATSLVS